MDHKQNTPYRAHGATPLLVLVIALTSSQRSCADPVGCEQAVELLLRRGLVEPTMDEESEKALQRNQEDPAVYADVIAESLEFPQDERELAWSLHRYRLGRALQLARIIGPDFARDAVRKCLRDSGVRLETCRRTGWDQSKQLSQDEWTTLIGDLAFMRDQALNILGEFNHADAVAECVPMLEKLASGDYQDANQVVILRYLEKVGSQRPDIRIRIAQLHDDSRSRLRRDPQLKRVMDALNEPAKGTKDPASQPSHGAS